MAGSKIHYMGTTTQRSDETVAYTVDFANVGTPSSPTAAIYAKTDYSTDLAGTKMTGAAGVSGDVVTMPLIHTLVDTTYYRVEVTATVSGNTVMRYFEIHCDDDEA